MKTTLLAFTATSLFTASLFAQGDLNPPPGGPTTTMKTLAQIEARTAIPSSPAVPIAGPHFIISAPGSYYLTGNVEVVSGNGINITASNVTLDLNGFSLISTTVANPSSGNAIDLAGGISGIEIKNGHITGGTVRTYVGSNPWDAVFTKAGWYRGITDLSASPSQGLLLSHLTVEKCGDSGISLLGGRAVLQHITANNNGGTGIFAASSSVTHANTSYNAGVGCYVARGNLAHITASSNRLFGMLVLSSCVTNCSSNSNGKAGIFGDGASVNHSRAEGNGENGINAGLGVVSHCVGFSNDQVSGSWAQIYVLPGGQRDACVPAAE